MARRFVLRLATGLLGVLATCAALNLVIDPHGLHRWVDLVGINHLKPRASQMPEAFKYRAIDELSPRTLLLGNSRVEMGWDPEHLPEKAFGRTVNAAVPGSGLAAMSRLADHAWLRSRPNRLVIGLEFFDCLARGPRPEGSRAAVSVWSLDQPALQFHLGRGRALLADVLSLDTLSDALITIARQHDRHAAHLRADGFQTAREYPDYVRVDGVRKMFEQREGETLRARIDGSRSMRHDDGRPSTCFDALEGLLERARTRDQEVWLATYPYHARLLEIIVQGGFLPAYEDWKREITRVVEESRAAGTEVVLRDFGGYHDRASEPIEFAGAPVRNMQWYWESGHFKAALGREMLDVMRGEIAPEPGFGEELRSESIENQLLADRARRARFRIEQAAVVEEISAAIARHRQ